MENQEKKPTQTESQKKKSVVYYMLFELGIEFAVILALPLLAFIYAGKWADARYGTKYFVIIGILLALTLSSYMIYKKIKELKNFLDSK
jgi:uncharacterized membrane protein